MSRMAGHTLDNHTARACARAGHEETMVCTLRHMDENTVALDIMGHGGMGNEDGVMMSTTYTRKQ